MHVQTVQRPSCSGNMWWPLSTYYFILYLREGVSKCVTTKANPCYLLQARQLHQSQDPVVCLVGTLAEYSHHRHVELPMPTDSLSSLVQWASQPILQVQQKDETIGVLQSHSAQLPAGQPLPQGSWCAADIRLRHAQTQTGRAQAAQKGGMEASVLKRQMRHSAHDKSCLKQMCTPMKDMAAGAGHPDRTGRRGSSAISARLTTELEDLYWPIFPTRQAGFKVQVQAWLQQESSEVSLAVLHIIYCWEDLANVLLRNLAVGGRMACQAPSMQRPTSPGITQATTQDKTSSASSREASLQSLSPTHSWTRVTG